MSLKKLINKNRSIDAENIDAFYFANKTTLNNTTTFKIKSKRDDNEMTKNLQKFNNHTR